MKILSATSRSGFKVELSYDNGEVGVVDLSSLAGRGVFAAWNQPSVFEQVSVTPEGALAWPGELDLCPDALYLQMTGKTADEVFPSLKNRLSHA
jgi:hypothetical protein